MRSIVIVFLILGLSQAHNLRLVAIHDGQPGCFIRYEFERLWRNNFDQYSFWRCERWGEGAVKHPCPPYTSFQDFWQTCLPNDIWEWTPYSEPPTRPGEQEVDQCEPIENPTPCPTSPPFSTTPDGGWNATTPDGNWNATTPDGNWNATTPDGNWNATTPDGNWNATTPDGGWNATTSTPDWSTTPIDNETNSTTPPFLTTTTGQSITTEPTETPTEEPTEDTTRPPCPTCPPQITTTPRPPEVTTTPQTPTPPDGDIISICPGAEEHQYGPGDMDCNPPSCTEEQWLEGTLYPTRDPTKFFQCGPGTGNLYVMPCGPATCFSFTEQVCVHVEYWRNYCTPAGK